MHVILAISGMIVVCNGRQEIELSLLGFTLNNHHPCTIQCGLWAVVCITRKSSLFPQAGP